MSKKTKSAKKDLKELLARSLADYDNFKKRVEKEQLHWESRSISRIVGQMLPIMDMLVTINVHTKDSGLAIAIHEFESVLNNLGVEKIVAESGRMFSSEEHEVVESESHKKNKDGEILEVMQTGWKMKDGAVIRFAKVKVNKKHE